MFLTLAEGFPCIFLSCKANARVKLAKTGHGPHSSTLVVTCVVRLLFVLFYVLFVCKCVLPPGDNPIAVNKYIDIDIHTVGPGSSGTLHRVSQYTASPRTSRHHTPRNVAIFQSTKRNVPQHLTPRHHRSKKLKLRLFTSI